MALAGGELPAGGGEKAGSGAPGWRCGSKLKSWQRASVDDIEGGSWLCNAQVL